MPSIFANAMEDSDVMNEFQSVIEPETLAEASSAAAEEFQEIESTGKTVDDLVEGQSKMMDVQAEVEYALEHGGLTSQAQRMLKKSLTHIVGKNITNKRLPALENFEGNNRVYSTVIALEGIMQTVKDFWTAIKNQAVQFWNKTKSWYIKTFDVANKIIARAKKVNERSSSISASAKENSFEFSGAKLLAVNYQTKDPQVCINGYEALNVVVVGAVENLSKENSSTKADKMLEDFRSLLTSSRTNATKQYKSGQDVGALFAKSLNEWYTSSLQENPFKPDITEMENDPALKTKLNGGDERVEVRRGANLPGNRTIFKTSIDFGKNPNTDPIELLKANRPVISDTLAKPKELEETADVKTLNVGQIGKIAEVAESLGETILKYKTEFESRDRFFNNMMKGLDQIVKELDGKDIATESFEGFAMEASGKVGNGMPKPNARPKTNNRNQPRPKPQPQPQTQPNPTPTAGSANATQAQPQPGQNPAGASGGGSQPPAVINNPGTNAPDDEPEQHNTAATQTAEEAESIKAQNEVDKYFRRLASTLAGLFRRDMSYQGQLITMGIKSSNVYLTYAEQSLAQYGV